MITYQCTKEALQWDGKVNTLNEIRSLLSSKDSAIDIINGCNVKFGLPVVNLENVVEINDKGVLYLHYGGFLKTANIGDYLTKKEWPSGKFSLESIRKDYFESNYKKVLQ